MKELVRAALGERTSRLLLIDTAPSTIHDLLRRRETTFVVVTSARAKSLRKIRDQLGRDGKYTSFRAELDQLPFNAPQFDVVIIDANQNRWDEPVEQLRSLRSLVRPGGSIMVVNRLKEGPFGSVTSVANRVLRQQTLPRASDLTKWMLLAGLRKVRQANVPKAVVPTVLTWAEARARAWEETIGLGEPPKEAQEGDASEGDASEGDASEVEASEGDASEGDASEGDASEGDASEEEASDDDDSGKDVSASGQ